LHFSNIIFVLAIGLGLGLGLKFNFDANDLFVTKL